MKKRITFLVTIFAMLPLSVVYAAEKVDIDKRIEQCVTYLKEEEVTEQVVVKYCTCMSSNMDETERLPIIEWEKQKPYTRKKCEREARWLN